MAQDPGGFDFSVASWTNIIGFYGPSVAESLPKGLSAFSSSVRSKYPRTKGDAIHLLDLESEPSWLQKLFPGDGNRGCVEEVTPIFGRYTLDVIEQSELRQWEKRNGFIDRTNCVKLAYTLKLRTTYEDGIANILHSNEIFAPVDDY